MKNVGIIVDNEFNSDIRVRKEIEILKNNGFSIHVLCFAFDSKQYPEEKNINIVRIPLKRSLKNLLFLLANRLPFYNILWKKNIKQFILKNEIEILHVHDLYMSKSAHLAIKSLEKEIPIILDLHENFPEAVQLYNWTKGVLRNWLSQPKKWLQKEPEYLSYADKLIVLSESFKDELLKRYAFLSPENIIAFPNVIDLRAFEKYTLDPTIKKNDHITLLYFGGIAERRGIFDTITVFKEALKLHQNLELLFIGPIDKADKNRFYNEISQPEVMTNITYIPWIDISKLPSYLHISDIFLSPLHKNKQHESGIANKLFQYMYGGKPIIVSDCKPQKDLIVENDCGLFYTNQQEYLDCIIRLVENNDLRDKLGKNAQEKLYEHYDNDSFKNILVSVYKEF
jgi:glycosyltransferase involved in cell wall biosynthesis